MRGARRIMDFIDVDSYKWSEYADRSPPWKSWLYRYEARELARYERRIAAEFDATLVVSEQERRYFPGGPPATLTAVSNGVDLGFFTPRAAPPPGAAAPAVVFTGVMDYRPNVDGVTWFVERLWGRIRAGCPSARLLIVGSRPTAAVLRLAQHPGVEVTGFVPDVRDYLAQASVCVAPLRIARGVQNKVLEAMAMGRPVVTTAAAFEGLEAEPGRDLLVAAGEDEFVAAVGQLLADPVRAAAIGVAARQCVERHYRWDDNLRVLEGLVAGPVGVA
jgi:sugar transferase (PEP-CTERM/EpsH1 system associated)